jgi:hypothetical protein
MLGVSVNSSIASPENCHRFSFLGKASTGTTAAFLGFANKTSTECFWHFGQIKRTP